MSISASVRSPADVIKMTLEDCGVHFSEADTVAAEVEKRLARCLNSLSTDRVQHMIIADGESLGWGHVADLRSMT